MIASDTDSIFSDRVSNFEIFNRHRSRIIDFMDTCGRRFSDRRTIFVDVDNLVSVDCIVVRKQAQTQIRSSFQKHFSTSTMMADLPYWSDDLVINANALLHGALTPPSQEPNACATVPNDTSISIEASLVTGVGYLDCVSNHDACSYICCYSATTSFCFS